jgi:hypothetical protein
MKFISNLVPREGRFFEYLNQHASPIAQGSGALAELLRTILVTPPEPKLNVRTASHCCVAIARFSSRY